MATFLTGRVRAGPAAQQIVAANANRLALIIRVRGAREVFLGPTSGVTVETGFPWTARDGPFPDEYPTLGAWYVISPQSADVRWLEVTA